MRATAKVRNTSSRVVIDGGGKVTLGGAGIRRILYMDTCDKRQVCCDRTGPDLGGAAIHALRNTGTARSSTGRRTNPAVRYGRCAASAALPARRSGGGGRAVAVQGAAVGTGGGGGAVGVQGDGPA